MPHLRVGQTWTVPLYNPFRTPHSPMEILQATVERDEHITWDSRRTRVRLIVYRGDTGAGRGNDDVRGRMWVRDDGVVLRQEVVVFRSPVQFERVPDRQSRAIRESLPDNWRQSMPAGTGVRLLKQLNEAIAFELPREPDAEADAEDTSELESARPGP
jgi:hypothetical protein